MPNKEALVASIDAILLKYKKYIKSPLEAPEGVYIYQGPKGGIYYQTAGLEEKTPEIFTGDIKDNEGLVNRPDISERLKAAESFHTFDGLKKLVFDKNLAVRITAIKRLSFLTFVGSKPLISKKEEVLNIFETFKDSSNASILNIIALSARNSTLDYMLRNNPNITSEVVEKIFSNMTPDMALYLKNSKYYDQENSQLVEKMAERIDKQYLPELLENTKDISIHPTIISRMLTKDITLNSTRKYLGYLDNLSPAKQVYEKKNIRESTNEIIDRLNFNDVVKLRTEPQTFKRNSYRDIVDTRITEKFRILEDLLSIGGESMAKIGEEITSTVKAFEETGIAPEFSLGFKAMVSSIDGKDITSSESYEAIDMLYKMTDFNYVYQNTRDEWLDSAESDGAGILKEAVMKVFGTPEIRSHDGILNTDWDEYIANVENVYPLNNAINFVKAHKNLTKKLLDIKYPGDKPITLYRGTTEEEFKKIEGADKNTKILIKSNPLSSWTVKKKVAFKFGKRVITSVFNKDEVWSSFLTHSHSGTEAEFIVIGKDRDGSIVDSSSSKEPKKLVGD